MNRADNLKQEKEKFLLENIIKDRREMKRIIITILLKFEVPYSVGPQNCWIKDGTVGNIDTTAV